MKQLKTKNERVHKKENKFKDQTTLTDQEIENTQNDSSQQLYTTKLENEVEELKYKNLRLDRALRENEDELDASNRSMWQVHDKCKRLDWRCRNQYWQIQDLERQNIELKKRIEKQPAHFGTSPNSAYFEPSPGDTDAQYYQPTYYPTDQNQTFLDESTNEKPSQTILENEERYSTSPRKHNIPQEEHSISKQMPENDGAWYSTGDVPVNFQSHQRPVGIPMLEHRYNKISAEMHVPHGKVAFSQNNPVNSSSSFYSNVEELRPHQVAVAESFNSAVSERLHADSTDEKAVSVTERHYCVTYNDVQLTWQTFLFLKFGILHLPVEQ